MAQVKKGDTVKVHYTGTLDDGTTFDSSKGREPLEFTVGSGMVIAGFDDAVMGLEPGQTNKVRIPPEKAYGESHQELILTVPKDKFPAGIVLSEGEQFALPQPDGRRMPVTVTKVTDTEVTLDANHALAGKALTFEVELVEIV